MEFEEIDKIIITYIGEGLSQKEMSKILKKNNIEPNSISIIEKRISNLKKLLGAKTAFQFGMIIGKMDKKAYTPSIIIPLPASGSFCQKCEAELEIRARAFYCRGKYFSVLVCKSCNALYDNPEDSFEKHVGIKKKVL